MYARRAAGRTLTFDFAAGLLEDNLLLADRETDSVWSQMDGRAIDGPLEGEPLTTVPSLQTTWEHWRRLHPDTEVMVIAGEEGRPYVYRTWVPGTPRPEERPAEHAIDYLGLGLVIEGEALFVPLAELAAVDGGTVEVGLGHQPVTIHHAPEGMTAWAEDAAGNLLEGVLAYQWGWERFFPDGRVWRVE